MRAAIQAGGKGSRIAAYFPELPKPMIPLNDKPLLQHQIEMLAMQGFKDITLIVGYKAEVIKTYFGNGERFGVTINYITENSPLGTGGALALLPKEDTLLLLGDVYCEVDFNRFLSYFKKKNADILLFAHPNSHPHDSDIIISNEDNQVIAWASKKDASRGELRNLVNAGLYVFKAEALPQGKPVNQDLEHDIIIPHIHTGKVYSYRSTEYIKDIGTPERFAQTQRDIHIGIPSARSLRNKQKAVFMDRDGTINILNGFITKPDQLKLIDGATEAIQKINASKYLAICVTNQSVIARGDVTFDELNQIHARLDKLLGDKGAYLDDLLFCPHHTDKGFGGERLEFKFDCSCRKPKPGLLLEAAERYHINLSESIMIGDSDIDIKAGHAAGCSTIAVGNMVNLNVKADFVYKDLYHAVSDLLKGAYE